jgi:hypothetical protein
MLFVSAPPSPLDAVDYERLSHTHTLTHPAHEHLTNLLALDPNNEERDAHTHTLSSCTHSHPAHKRLTNPLPLVFTT